MSYKGGTYTIVVDKDRNIVSVTLNGKPMVEKEQDLLSTRPTPTDPPGRFDPAAYNVTPNCICLGEAMPEDPGATCVWKWGKLF